MKGKAIIKDVMREHGVTADEFLGRSHKRPIVKVRVEPIQRMSDAGLNVCLIARLIQPDHTTVSYWLRPERRAFRKAYHSRCWIERRPAPSGVIPGQKVTPEQRMVLQGLYLAGKMDEVLKMQADLGVSKQYARKIGSRRHKEKTFGDPNGLPLLAPIRDAMLLRCPSCVSEARA
jgi:hypothetical protein